MHITAYRYPPFMSYTNTEQIPCWNLSAVRETAPLCTAAGKGHLFKLSGRHLAVGVLVSDIIWISNKQVN